jgi:hypothetical protein
MNTTTKILKGAKGVVNHVRSTLIIGAVFPSPDPLSPKNPFNGLHTNGHNGHLARKHNNPIRHSNNGLMIRKIGQR